MTGEVTIGQRCREVFGEHNVFICGFLTNLGTGTFLRLVISPFVDDYSM